MAGLTLDYFQFPATQVPSADPNALDDYQEGLANTCGISFGGANTGITYGTRAGQYEKIGRFVTGWAEITLTSKGSSTGLMRITDLPFTAGASSYGGIQFLFVENVSSSGSLTGLIDGGGTSARIFLLGASGTSSFQDTNASDTMHFIFEFHYRVA